MDDKDVIVDEQPLLFELRMPIDGTNEIEILERTPDEHAARLAFDACRKMACRLSPRPKVSLDLMLGTIVIDMFEQTKAGDEFEKA